MAVLEQEGYLAPAPHQRRAGARPTRATGSSSIGSTRPAALGDRRHPAGPLLLRRGPRRARADAGRHQPAAVRPHPTTPRWWSAPPTEAAIVRSVQLVGLAPRVALRGRRALQRRGREAHHRVRRRRRRRRDGRGRRLAGPAPDRRVAGRGRASGGRARGRHRRRRPTRSTPILRVGARRPGRRPRRRPTTSSSAGRRAWRRRSTRSTR